MNTFGIMLLFVILIVTYPFVTHSVANNSVTTCLSDESLALLRFSQEFSLKKPKPQQIVYPFPFPTEETGNCFPKTKSWKDGKDCCEWEGVSCDMKTRHVITLDLSNSCLSGPFLSNSSLFHLLQLEQLNLASNDFSFSQIPSTFGVLSRLTHLNLSYSMFAFDVPSEIGRLTNLVSLDLSSNYGSNLRWTEFPKSLTNLKVLHLKANDLSKLLPQSFASLSSLTSLSLGYCALSGEFPKNIFVLPEIKFIDLSANQLNGSLPTFHSANKLEFLVLRGGRFYGNIPTSIGNLSSLITLDLTENNFDGQIPFSIGNLLKLKSLSLSNYNNTNTWQIPSSLGNLSQLSKLSLSGYFNGELPQTLGNLEKLEYLYIYNEGGVGLTGELPSSLGNLKQLTTLTIIGNKFSSSIPSSLRNLTSLTVIKLSNNNLSGIFPSYLFSVPSLFQLSLDSNKLSGPLSIQNVSISGLSSMDLHDNELSGQIPSTISKLKNVKSIDLSTNNFSGSVEFDIFSGLSGLVDLDLSGNSLTVKHTDSNLTFPKFQTLKLPSCNIHKFPDFLATQDLLRVLDLSSNKLEGKIPKWFHSIGVETLLYLNLSHNSITGFGNAPFILPWHNIEVLDLHSNPLQGPLVIPPISLKYLFMSENQLVGIIPQSFCNLSNLEVLDVSENNLSGDMPQCLGGFSRNLMVLSLRGNSFSGTIPHTFAEGNQLKTIDLSHNQLQGMVPKSLINCTTLEVLNLGNNQISDRFPFWLQNLPELQVLVLRFNKFHGPIWDSQKSSGFKTLRIIDLSFNAFVGALPAEYFRNWSSMSDVSTNSERYVGERLTYYKVSLTVVNKGLEMKLVRILTIFTSIDLSNNNFFGDIPSNIGDLRSLIVLNLSSNHFEGFIPHTFGNLKAIESLDLSNNKLSGRIPQELESLSFLQYLNLSQNQLTGLIPQGRHFDTFPNSSFEGNAGLCGFPLSKKCQITDGETPIDDENYESESENGFGWKPVVIGYGSSFVFGAIGGFILFSKKPNLFIKIYGREKKRRR